MNLVSDGFCMTKCNRSSGRRGESRKWKQVNGGYEIVLVCLCVLLNCPGVCEDAWFFADVLY